MDTRTGEIYNEFPEELISEKEHLTSIDKNDITTKQKENLQVSKHDNKSKLGKLYTECRKTGWSSLTKNQKRNLKKKVGLR